MSRGEGSRWEGISTEPTARQRWSSAGEKVSVVDRIGRLRTAFAIGATIGAGTTTAMSEKAIEAQRWGVKPPEGQGIAVELTPEEYLAKQQTKAPCFIQTSSPRGARLSYQSGFGRSTVDLSLCVKQESQDLQIPSPSYQSSECSPVRSSLTSGLLAPAPPCNSAPLPKAKVSPTRYQDSNTRSGSLQHEGTAGTSASYLDDLHSTQVHFRSATHIPEGIVCGGEEESEEESEAEEELPSIMPLHRSQLRVDQLLAAGNGPDAWRLDTSLPASSSSTHHMQRPMSLSQLSPQAHCTPLPPSSPRPLQTAPHPGRPGSGRAMVRALPSKSSPATLSLFITSPSPTPSAEHTPKHSQQSASPFVKAAQNAWPAMDGGTPQPTTSTTRHLRTSSNAGQSSLQSALNSPRGEAAEGAKAPGSDHGWAELSARSGSSGAQQRGSPRPPEAWAQDGEQQQVRRQEQGLLGAAAAAAAARELQQPRSKSMLSGRSARSSWSGSLGSQPLSNCRAVSLQRQSSKQQHAKSGGGGGGGDRSLLTVANLQTEARLAAATGELPHNCFLVSTGDLSAAKAQAAAVLPLTCVSKLRFKYEFHDNKGSRGFNSKAW